MIYRSSAGRVEVVLAHRREPPLWALPKGTPSAGETLEQTALRETREETGLEVELVGEAGEFTMKCDGKKRRFVFYLMRAVGTTWDWPHHEGRDTFLVPFERVEAMLRREGYGELWREVRDQVRSLLPSNGRRDEAPVSEAPSGTAPAEDVPAPGHPTGTA